VNDERRIVLRAGEALTDIGIFLPKGFAVRPGIEVRVSGSAVERAVLEPCAVRARPFGAQPLPWEATGWERALDPCSSEDVAATTCLRSVSTEQRGAWVALLGMARQPERADLVVSVRAGESGREKRAAFTVDVRVDDEQEREKSAWFYGEHAWSECVSALFQTLEEAIARGQLARGDRIALRAVSRDGSRSRLASVTIPHRGRMRSAGLASMRKSARVGRYATLEVVRESRGQEDAHSFAIVAARRRDSAGEWGVELRCC
jgi:hypothetical protein